MSNSHRLEPRVLSILLGIALAACGVDSGVSVPSAPASPADGGATLTGENSPGMDSDAAVTEIGDNPATATVDGGSSEASAGSNPGGIDSGGASSGSVGGIGGATFTQGGAAGAGGTSALSDAGVGGTSSAPAPTALYFSEYVEGSSTNKALEITTSEHAVLDTCKVSAYFNGGTEASTVATLGGVLEPGQVLTLCTSTLQEKLGAVCGQVGHLTFNGNDAVALECNGNILDVIGQIGVDPGTAWGTGANTTLDHTLQRKCTVTHGDGVGADAFDPSVEWDALPVDTFSGLGARGC